MTKLGCKLLKLLGNVGDTTADFQLYQKTNSNSLSYIYVCLSPGGSLDISNSNRDVAMQG